MSMLEHDHHDRLLALVQQLFEIDEADVREALSRAALLVAHAFAAEKVDIFLYEEASQTLVALGVSETPLGRLEQALGMNRLQIANGGRTVEVFQKGTSYRNGQVQDDPEELA